jgi:hypothetical protein
MTYSNRATRRPSLSPQHTPQTHADYIAAVSPAVTAVIMRLLLWLCGETAGKGSRYGRVIYTAKAAAIMSALAALMVCLPGAFQEKKAFLESQFAKVGARLARITAKYIIWRQRKCWMWGGGFMCGAVARLPDRLIAARDQKSFDALIPD